MFFIGATGQLLTLILTVGLPFIFLLSGHQKSELNQNSKRFEVYQEINPYNFKSEVDSSSFTLVTYETKQQNLILLNSPHEKNPFIFYLGEFNGIELTGSGNKSPPLFIKIIPLQLKRYCFKLFIQQGHKLNYYLFSN